ncbi:MAG: response regulator transcription factor [Deltaproteobacteria bacterium]|nr:response regulator transcription factor [Deltaproteobacteria bacterium]
MPPSTRRDLTTLANHVSVRLAHLGFNATPDPGLAQLTRRQLEVAQHAARARTAGQIGKLLGISENTVKKHLKDIYARLTVANRAELAARMRHHAPRETAAAGVSWVRGFAVTRAKLAS